MSSGRQGGKRKYMLVAEFYPFATGTESIGILYFLQIIISQCGKLYGNIPVIMLQLYHRTRRFGIGYIIIVENPEIGKGQVRRAIVFYNTVGMKIIDAEYTSEK